MNHNIETLWRNIKTGWYMVSINDKDKNFMLYEIVGYDKTHAVWTIIMQNLITNLTYTTHNLEMYQPFFIQRKQDWTQENSYLMLEVMKIYWDKSFNEYFVQCKSALGGGDYPITEFYNATLWEEQI